ncbi:MAG: hypothetical protein V4754_04980 [Pseudomonadota bacterium]
MTSSEQGLANARQIEQLADRLSAAADAMHARVLQAIARRAPDDAPGAAMHINQAEAQAVFEHEVRLRQHANSLYADAARHAGSGLQLAQQTVLQITDTAAAQIEHIAQVKDLLLIGADLLALGGAAVAGRPGEMLKALEQVRDHGNAIKQGKHPGEEPA